MGDSYDFGRIQSAIELKGALNDVDLRLYGATTEQKAADVHAQEILSADLPQSLDRTGLKEVLIQADRIHTVSAGNVLEFRQPDGQKHFALVKEINQKTNAARIIPLSAQQATSLQQQFPSLHQVVLSQGDYNLSQNSKPLNSIVFTPLVEFIAAAKEYILALFEIIVGKQLSRAELESKALAISIAFISCLLIIGSLISVWIAN